MRRRDGTWQVENPEGKRHNRYDGFRLELEGTL
ncbi:hypothetical protein L195_g033186, partial [Trifolium pratense]